MRLLACLLTLALANAATLPQTLVTPVKKLEISEQKDTLDNVSSEQELIDQSNVVKDVPNNLRKGAGIPVAVVVEQVKSDKQQANEVGIDCDDASNIKRVEVDLKNPGSPQRIEHDTQNPEHFDDGQTSLDNVDVKQEITNTEDIFNSNAQDIQQTLQNWVTSNQQIANIQKNMLAMKESVEAQISLMNQTIHKYWAPAATNIQSVTDGAKLNIEAGLKTLEKNVQSGMKVLTNDFKAIGSKPESSVKAEGEPTAPAQNNQWYQPFLTQWNDFTHNMQTQLANLTSQFTPSNEQQNNIFQNIQQNFQNLFPNNNPGTQSDENATPRPTIWQNIQNLFQPSPPASVENDPVEGAPARPNPIAQAVQAIQSGIQNNPIVQGVQSIIRPPANTPANTLSESQPAKPEKPTSDEGTNVVPDKPAEPEKQKEKPEVKPEVQQLASGPIKQMIEKSPIMQGLAGAVQRIQHTIRPTSPREAETQKGHYHKPGSSSDEHHSGNSGVVKSDDAKPESLPQKEPELEKQPAKSEEKPSEIPAKEQGPKKTE